MTEQHPTRGPEPRGIPGAERAPLADRDIPPVGPARDIPQATVSRLATYLRVLGELADEGTLIVSSEELATASGVGSAKLRKDLSFLGPNGVRGVGYDVIRLQSRIENALGLDRGHRVVLVGVGNLGRALAGYSGFDRRGFSMVGLFDNSPERIGRQVGGLTVRSVDELEHACRELDATIGVIATPAEAAQAVCDLLVRFGLHCVLSFSPVALEVPDHVEVRRVDLAVEMQVLSFNGARNHDGAPEPAPSARGARPARLGRTHGPRSSSSASRSSAVPAVPSVPARQFNNPLRQERARQETDR